MFNGIIYNTGKIKSLIKRNKGIDIFLKSNLKVSRKDIGISVSCDGVCLTLTRIKNKTKKFYLSKETIDKSTFKNVKIGNKINLELPLKFGQRISGHICQGHVDCTAKLSSIKKKDKAYLYCFNLNKKNLKNLIPKASITINGVSLTISKKINNGFEVWIIPHTLKLTNLSNLKINDLVNVEIDILSKYVKNYIK